MKINKVVELKNELEKSDSLKNEFLKNPLDFLEKIETEEPIKDKKVFLFIVGIVGIVLLSSIILGAIIIFTSDDYSTAKIPEFLVSIGSTSLGAIVGLLAPSPRNN